MDEPLQFALAVLARVRSVWLSPQVLGSALAAAAALLVAARVRFGRGWARRIATAELRTDAAYTVFYLGGIYAFLVSGPLYRGLNGLVAAHAPSLQLGLLHHLPWWAQFLVASVAMDGVLYWTHRAMHAFPPLWRFQLQGRDTFDAWIKSFMPHGADTTVVRTIPTVTGFVSEFTGRQDEDGREITDRKILLAEVRDGRIAELTIYCSGDWDAELRARHAAETQLIRP